MASSPPSTPRSSLPPLLPSRPAPAMDEAVLFFGLEGAPREACRTRQDPNTLVFATELTGTVCESREDALVIATAEREVLLRHLLPLSVSLAGLVGREVAVKVEQRYGQGGRACIRCELRDPDGRLILFGWDGRMPRREDVLGLGIRGALENQERPSVHIQHELGLARLKRGQRHAIQLESLPASAFLLRGGADDLSLLIVRR